MNIIINTISKVTIWSLTFPAKMKETIDIVKQILKEGSQ